MTTLDMSLPGLNQPPLITSLLPVRTSSPFPPLASMRPSMHAPTYVTRLITAQQPFHPFSTASRTHVAARAYRQTLSDPGEHPRDSSTLRPPPIPSGLQTFHVQADVIVGVSSSDRETSMKPSVQLPKLQSSADGYAEPGPSRLQEADVPVQ
ncbi:hypothetical protein SNOG_06653 [Parastagonospora nodorum SN15]|uniref:Uncharacterized protein n=1 Tax=Phaeosphaeria nodorum (strain SN15 / ATCC MYA-4574 / FGSC 10173) TaxID=321614 RepID=Q0UNL1_PHANO|nr:hypothetical protein SNOG_06653 [Parastagonospora nodorum SN15]EAT86484.1 hypothetical protein SNOG_06653 [Parastagonospora nodorum SN15]